ncbi:MAG: site-specific DNA-methyltransferase [Acidimicrobiales bacterium]
MPQDYSGRLELTWTNKEKTLLAHEDGTYEWVDPSDYRVAEVRLLHDVATVGETKPDGQRAVDNLLIRGDALHALHTLNRTPEFAKEYVGKVRLVYIDPPFNTGQAFAQYDDNLEHSVWLTMLRDRLVQIKPLLAPNGSVWVHLDDAEVHRCRVVLDEVFGTDNFIASIVWEKDKGRRNDTDISSVHDGLLVYAIDAGAWSRSRNLLPRTAAHDSRYRNPDGDPRGPWLQGDNGTAKSGTESARFPITLPSGRTVLPPKGNYWRFSMARLEEAVADGRVWFGQAGDSLPVIKRYLTDVQQGLVPRTWWSADEAGTNQDAKRDHLRRMFPDLEPFATPKPESLLRRIIHISTNPGEIVLDCFAGSGTTAAVSHKMGRRWVTAERSAETVATYTLPRLTKVVNGEGPGGITSIETPTGEGLPDGVKAGEAKAAAKVLETMAKAGALEDIDQLDADIVKALSTALRAADKTTTETLWTGGGGFRLLDVGPSKFVEVDGRVYLADWATNGALAEAIAAQYGYAFEPDPPFSGRKGKTRLAVVDGLVNEGVIRLLVDALPPDERVAICGTAVDPDARPILKELRPGSTMRKVPAALLDEYRQSRREWLRLATVLDWSEAAALLDISARNADASVVG